MNIGYIFKVSYWNDSDADQVVGVQVDLNT